jgi:hypothetical protein
MEHRAPHVIIGNPNPPSDYEREVTDAATLGRIARLLAGAG